MNKNANKHFSLLVINSIVLYTTWYLLNFFFFHFYKFKWILSLFNTNWVWTCLLLCLLNKSTSLKILTSNLPALHSKFMWRPWAYGPKGPSILTKSSYLRLKIQKFHEFEIHMLPNYWFVHPLVSSTIP